MRWLIDLFQSVVFQTVMSGVLVFILSQIIQKFFLEPLQKYKEVIGKIDNQLKFYTNVITNPGNILSREIYLECSHTLRSLSCELEASYKQIPLKKLDTRRKVSDAASRLIRLSNNLNQTGEALHNSGDIDEIRKDLNIPEL